MEEERTEADAQEELIQQQICPECHAAGEVRTFPTAAALGVHRSRTHGVRGRSSQRRAASTTRRRRSGASASTTRRTRTRQTPASKTLNRDALLRTVFPDGIPSSAEMLGEVNSWLDHTEALFTKASARNGK